MTTYKAIAYMASSGMDRKQITDIIHAIISESLYVQNKEAILYAECQLKDYFSEREEQVNEPNK